MSPDERFAAASQFPEAAPRNTPGATICDTPQSIERFRMIVCLSGLKLEAAGIRTHRHVSCLARARQDYGITARTAEVAYQRLREKMLAHGIITS